MSPRSTKSGLFALAIALAFANCCRAEEDNWKARLLLEAPKSWAALKDFGAELEGEFTYDWKCTTDPKLPERHHMTKFLIKGENLRFEKQVGKETTVVAGAFNSNYLFLLEGEAGSNNLQVRQIESATGMQERVAKQETSLVLEYVYAPWFFLGKPLSHWLKEPGFVVTKVTPEVRNGKTLVRMEFDIPSKPPGKQPSVRREASQKSWCLLDPNDYWTIQEYRLLLWWGTSAEKIEYGDRVDGFPMHRRVVQDLIGEVGVKDVVKNTWEMRKIAHRTAADRDFTLTAFGIPEPRFEERSFRTWHWFLLAAAVCGVAAFLLRRFLRRNRTKVGP